MLKSVRNRNEAHAQAIHKRHLPGRRRGIRRCFPTGGLFLGDTTALKRDGRDQTPPVTFHDKPSMGLLVTVRGI